MKLLLVCQCGIRKGELSNEAVQDFHREFGDGSLNTTFAMFAEKFGKCDTCQKFPQAIQLNDYGIGDALENPHHPRDVMRGYETWTCPIHKHGFVTLVDVMPRFGRTRENPSIDWAIAQAARVSYGGARKTQKEDDTLIRLLMRHRHTVPFEHCVLKFHISLPIFIARQWIKHRTASTSEISGRYTELPAENYFLPGEWRRQGTSNKQGGEEVMDYTPDGYDEDGKWDPPVSVEDLAVEEYKQRLEAGVSRELARTCLPVSVYTQWYWKIDLHNLLHFLSLRKESHAQKEIRDYADAIHDMLMVLAPATMAAWHDYIYDAVTLTRQEVAAIQATMENTKRAFASATHVDLVYPHTPPISTNAREQAEWVAKAAKLGF